MDPAAVNLLSSPACTGCSTRPLSSVYVICQSIAAALQFFRAQGVTKRQTAAAMIVKFVLIVMGTAKMLTLVK